jgi:D-serine deaminase-like pyridoxal phosphate-dependent protein
MYFLNFPLFQLIGKAKLRRFAALAKQAKVSICVDDPTNIKDISAVAVEAGVNIDCVVEINVGQDRLI